MTTRTTARFAVVGVANTLVDLALFALLVGPWGVVFANVVSTSAGMLCSYLLNGRWMFAESVDTKARLLAFLAVTLTTMWVLQPVLIVGLGWAAALAWRDIPEVVAKVGALAITTVVNYLGYRHLVWPASDGKAHRSRPG